MREDVSPKSRNRPSAPGYVKRRRRPPGPKVGPRMQLPGQRPLDIDSIVDGQKIGQESLVYLGKCLDAYVSKLIGCRHSATPTSRRNPR